MYVATYLFCQILSQCVLLGNTTPKLSDLQKDIVPKYAARWRDLGIQLNIPIYTLDIIAKDNANDREHARSCCRGMLNKWIETNTEATWNELHEAIANLPVLSGDESSKRKEVIIFQNFYCIYLLTNVRINNYSYLR